MAGRGGLGPPKLSASTLREQVARTTLRNVRMQGHNSVELRQAGKRLIFFCSLCLSPCYSDSALFDHLKGHLHTRRFAAAQITLRGPNPWPYNDGVLFFDNSRELDEHLKFSNSSQLLLDSHSIGDGLIISKYVGSGNVGHLDSSGTGSCSGKNLDADKDDFDLVVPDVLLNNEKSSLGVRFVGLGQISAKLHVKDDNSKEIRKIWCEWLGKMNPADEGIFEVPELDFAVVTFRYHYELGRRGFIEDVRLMLSNNHEEREDKEGTCRKRKSVSDPEDLSDSLSLYDSSADGSRSSRDSIPRFSLDDLLLSNRFISNKVIRRELRRQHHVVAEKMCGVCQQKILLGKDVAAILNLKTGKLACSSRNTSGAFHVYHISCLIHWILLCEYEIFLNQQTSQNLPTTRKTKRGYREVTGARCYGKRNAKGAGTGERISSVFCPECQGTGTEIEDELEIPRFRLSKMFKCKIKISESCKAWMKNPEVLQNCSTGFHFPSTSGESVQEKVSPLKLLHIYSGDA